jgi:hypothetical protein
MTSDHVNPPPFEIEPSCLPLKSLWDLRVVWRFQSLVHHNEDSDVDVQVVVVIGSVFLRTPHSGTAGVLPLVLNTAAAVVAAVVVVVHCSCYHHGHPLGKVVVEVVANSMLTSASLFQYCRNVASTNHHRIDIVTILSAFSWQVLQDNSNRKK